jgi:hypothetical protein
MVLLLGALALASSIVHPAGRPGQVQTLYQSPTHHTISAFAENHGVLAWFEPNPTKCNVVWVLQGVVRDSLPAQGGSYRNVTCRWQVPAGSTVGLALASGAKTVRALWSLRESATHSPLRFDYVLGAALSDRNERRFQEVAHGDRGAGLWLGGLAGDDDTLVFAVADVAFKDEVACLSTPKAPHACDMETRGGGVYRVVGRKPPTLVKGTTAAVAVACAGTRVAYVRAAPSATSSGRPVPSPSLPIEVRDARTGTLVTSIAPSGAPVAIALSDDVLAVLEQTADGMTLAWYDPSSGSTLGSLPVPAAATGLAAGRGVVVFRVGRSIRVLEASGKHARVVAKTVGTPIGLTVDGLRIAWAENVAGRGRIRAVTVG